MNQLKRVAVYNEFCRKKHAVLFATDIAARGLGKCIIVFLYIIMLLDVVFRFGSFIIDRIMILELRIFQ